MMAVNEGCGGAVTLGLAGTRGTGEGRRARILFTDIMNSGDGWSMGRQRDCVPASGVLLLPQQNPRKKEESELSAGKRQRSRWE